MNSSEKKLLRKKEQILASAIEIINKRGYSGATMEEIAEQLRMTKGSLYYYFKNKSDLMYQCHNFVITRATNDLKQLLQEDQPPTETLGQMVKTHMSYAMSEKEVFNLIMEPKRFFNKEQLELVLQLRRNYESLFEQIIHKGMERGDFQATEPSIVRMIILGAMNWVQQWYQPGGRLNKDEVGDIYAQYVLKILQ